MRIRIRILLIFMLLCAGPELHVHLEDAASQRPVEEGSEGADSAADAEPALQSSSCGHTVSNMCQADMLCGFRRLHTHAQHRCRQAAGSPTR